jgi:hypothetical protein
MRLEETWTSRYCVVGSGGIRRPPDPVFVLPFWNKWEHILVYSA